MAFFKVFSINQESSTCPSQIAYHQTVAKTSSSTGCSSKRYAFTWQSGEQCDDSMIGRSEIDNRSATLIDNLFTGSAQTSRQTSERQVSSHFPGVPELYHPILSYIIVCAQRKSLLLLLIFILALTHVSTTNARESSCLSPAGDPSIQPLAQSAS